MKITTKSPISTINLLLNCRNKKETGQLQALDKENAGLAELLDLIEKNGIDLKSFRGTSQIIWSVFETENSTQNKSFHEFDDIAINKTAKDRAIIENLIPG
jgi:hypothetical protein